MSDGSSSGPADSSSGEGQPVPIPSPAPEGQQAESTINATEAAAQPPSDSLQDQGLQVSAPIASTSSQAEGSATALQTGNDQIQVGPALPPRNYSRDPRLLTYTAPPPARLPSQALPKFFNFLAYFILITGSSAALLTLFYRHYVFPKIALTKARLTSLHKHDLSLYDKFLVSVHSLVNGNEQIYTRTKDVLKSREELLVDPTAEITMNEAPPSEKVLDSKQPEGVEPQDAEDTTQSQEQPELDNTRTVTYELRQSLTKLADSLSKYASTAASPADDSDDAVLPEPSASQQVMKSLEALTRRITDETVYSSTLSYASAYGYNYGTTGTGAALPTRAGTDKEAILKLKNDIRMLKGMFLTRRNFATPGKIESGIPVQ